MKEPKDQNRKKKSLSKKEVNKKTYTKSGRVQETKGFLNLIRSKAQQRSADSEAGFA